MIKKPLHILNFAVLLQQQRYIVAISFLFYLQNGLTFSDFLLYQSIFYLTGLLAEVPAGYIGDIFPRKNVLIFSYFLFLVRIILWITIPNPLTILLGEILYALSKAFYRGVSDGYVYDYLKEHKIDSLMLNKYGKLNFFMSTGSAISCLIGAWAYKYLGFSVLLSMELFCNSLAIFLLFFLPKIPQSVNKISFLEHIKRISHFVKKAVLSPDISSYMIFGGILTGITSVFVWNFQPLMKSFSIPAVMFGVVYFINHSLRASGSLIAEKFIKQFSLIKTAFLSWGLYIICFALLIGVLKTDNVKICIFVLLFICIAIGIQMIFNVGNVSRIHKMVISKKRATVSSVNSMFAGLFSGTFLMFFKFLAEHNSKSFAVYIFMVMFLLSFFILKHMSKNKYQTSD